MKNKTEYLPAVPGSSKTIVTLLPETKVKLTFLRNARCTKQDDTLIKPSLSVVVKQLIDEAHQQLNIKATSYAKDGE